MELTETNYKQSEVGFIPIDWDLVQLKDKIKVSRGGSPRPIQAYLTKNPNGINWIKIGDTSSNSKYITSAKEKIIEEGVMNSREVKIGDFLLSNSMSFGRPYILKIDGCIHDGWLVLQNYHEAFDKEYLYYLLSSNYILNQYKNKAAGSSVLNLNKELVSSVHLIAPTLEEQKAIATVLSDTDALIQALEKKIAKKKLIKKGVMQKLLTPKEGWVTRSLGEIAEFYKGKGLPKSAIEESGNYKCIHYGELFTTYKEIITKVVSRTNTNNDSVCSRINDVLMPTSDVTPNGLATASSINEDNVILGGDVLIIRIPEDLVLGSFLSYSIAQNRKQVMQLVTGTTVYHLYGSDMAKYILKYPTIDEQLNVVRILSDMEKQIEELEQKLSKYQLAKQGMMQQLLTGKIRLV